MADTGGCAVEGCAASVWGVGEHRTGCSAAGSATGHGGRSSRRCRRGRTRRAKRPGTSPSTLAQRAPPARRRGQEERRPRRGRNTAVRRVEPADHGLGRSRGGLSTKLHLAGEQGQKPLAVMSRPGSAVTARSSPVVLEPSAYPGWDGGARETTQTKCGRTRPTAPGRTRELRRRGYRCTSGDERSGRDRKKRGARRWAAGLRQGAVQGAPRRGMRDQPAQAPPRRGHALRQARRPLRGHLHRTIERMAGRLTNSPRTVWGCAARAGRAGRSPRPSAVWAV